MKPIIRRRYGRAHRLAAVLLVAAACGFTATLALAQSDDLVTAAKRGDLSAVNKLLESGTDVNDRKYTVSGTTTALMEASFYGHLEVVQALLAAKADVNATRSEKRDGETALTLAAQKGHAKVVQALLAAHADVDQPCCSSNALGEAARTNKLDMVKVLLAAKPDLNRQGRVDGRTPLMVAIDSGYWEMARLLVEAGADVNRRSKNGFTPLLKVASQNSPSSLVMVQLLLAARAEPDFRDCVMSYMTALGFASAIGNVQVVEALLDAHADVNLKQCDGKTALMLALQNDHQEVAKLLTSAGAK